MVDRDYIVNKIAGRMMTPDQFNFEILQAPSLYSLLSIDDISQINKLATSIRYTSKPIEKMELIDQILRRRGFAKFAGGTNRVVYKFLEDDSFVLKVATSKVAIQDNPREWINQQFLKPFVSKCFEVSPCGTVGLFERVHPITSKEEYESDIEDIYALLSEFITGKYVVDDIGTDAFMNVGWRAGLNDKRRLLWKHSELLPYKLLGRAKASEPCIRNESRNKVRG